MTVLNKQALREAAEKATPGRVGDRIDGSGSIKYECHGYDGSLVLRTDHKNMEYGFIGDNGDADELFFRLCVPDVILALLDELEAAEKRIAELEARAVTLPDEPFYPDGDVDCPLAVNLVDIKTACDEAGVPLVVRCGK
ncbi:ead/Ea22-like family protein [Salmonella enterica]|nr:ead/Ea22-like family protein [Salmonella enterica]